MKFVAKEDVKKYPLIDFTARVHLIEDLKDVSKCFDVISSASLIGFDTETKPSVKKGVHHHISLVQISVDNDVFLFRINKIGLIQELLNVFNNPNIVKVGIDIKNDITGLQKLKQFKPSNFIDLNQLAKKNNFQSIGAVKLTIMMLGFRISKRQRLSDWNLDILTDQQKIYAAIDAWICPKIFKAFKQKNYLLS